MTLTEEIPDRCLVCYSNASPGSQSAYLESSMTGCSMISKQLHVVFILRNVLEVPKEILQTYLLSRGSPETWVWVCENCSRLIVKAKHVYNDWLEASKRFKSVKEKIVDKIRTSVAKEGIQGLQGSSREKLDQKLLITNESRNFVNIREYGHFTDPFVDGDNAASQRLEKGIPDIPFVDTATVVKVEQEESVELLYFDEDGEPLEAEKEESHADEGEDNSMSVNETNSEEEYDEKPNGRRNKGSYRTVRIGSYFEECEHCHLRFPAKHFEAHVKLHHSKNAVGDYSKALKKGIRRRFKRICKICPITRFPTKAPDALEMHMEMHKTSGLHCFICLMVSSKQNELNKHLWHYHPETRKRPPPAVAVTAPTEKPKKKKSGLITKSGNVKCPKCTRFFPPGEMNKHLELHDTSPHHCNTCGNVFKTAENLKKHFKYHAALEATPLNSLSQFVVIPKTDMDDKDKVIARKSCRDTDSEILCSNRAVKLHMSIDDGAESDVLGNDNIIDWTPEMDKSSRRDEKVFINCHPGKPRNRGPYKRVPKVRCPWCSNFTCGNTMKEKLCEHLQSCEGLNESILSGKNELIICPFCKDYSFFTLEKSNFVEHLFCCRGELPDDANIPVTSRIFQCNICPATNYMNLSGFLDHCLYHTRRPYKCVKCPKRLALTANVHSHWRVHHCSDLKNVQPLHRFTTNTSLPQFYWWCAVCSEKFPDSESRDLHMVDIHKKELEKTYNCKHCSKRYWCLRELDLHEGTAHIALINPLKWTIKWNAIERRVNPLTRPFQRVNFHTCDVCQQHFHKKRLLREHRIRKHQLDMYICEMCGIGFSQQVTLNKHVELHDDNARKFACDECDASFTRATQIQSTRYPDVAVNPLVCQYCKKVFNSKPYLAIHIAQVHERKYRLVCHICGSGRTNQSQIDRHLAIAHGIGDRKKYEKRCTIEGCDKVFWEPSKLRAHISMHRQEPQFECKFCKKGFYNKVTLQRHELIHTNAETKPYECQLCHKRFPVRNYLYIHMKSHRNK